MSVKKLIRHSLRGLSASLTRWGDRVKRHKACLILSFLFLYCAGCARSLPQVTAARIPSFLLTPIEHPIVASPAPYTVKDLLLVIGQYEYKLEQANGRFEEIQFIQAEEGE